MTRECAMCGGSLRKSVRFCDVCGVPAEEQLPETRSGIAAFEMGEYLEAQAWFEKALKKRPGSSLLLRDAGHAAFHLRRYDRALERYDLALKAHPKLLDVLYNLGLLHMGQGRVNEALAAFTQASEILHPLVAGKYYLGLFQTTESLSLQCRLDMGLLLRQCGDLEQAIVQFQNVLEQQSNHVAALGNLGDCYLALERYAEAVRLYRRVLKAIPAGADQHTIRNDLGIAYHRMGEITKAVEQFKNILQEDPRHANALHNLAQIYVEEQTQGRIQKDFEELLKVAPEPAALLSALSRSMVTAATARKALPAQGEDILVGDSQPMNNVKELIRRASASGATVLILGENGTGKELVARSIHMSSARYDKPFVPIACSALSESLLESELFGHEKGSFTGAIGRKTGKFEAANQGTVFLDEIGEISLSTQVKLLRFLQEREFERVGGNELVHVDVRIVAATNRDLRKDVQSGRFREDLFYRLNVITIEMPPLRERGDDLEVLIPHFLKTMALKRPHRFEGVTSETMQMLRSHLWPGNVRELENVLERTVTLYDDVRIRPEHLPDEILRGEGVVATVERVSGFALESAEKEVIRRILRESNYNKRKAATRLGISRPTLYHKIRKYGLMPTESKV
jgi:transcriptional regulator with PAS, ATPase and Fis domain